MFDTHAHLQEDYEEVLKSAFAVGVNHIVNIALTKEDLDRGLEIHQKYPTVYLAAAIHPCYVNELDESFFDRISDLAKKKVLIAIGETGLDLYRGKETFSLQQSWLIRHIDLANRFNLPLIIHCRDAYDELFALLDKHPANRVVLHCFAGNMEQAKEAICRGYFLSMSGIITFKKNVSLHQIAKWAPLEKLLIETDAPYLAPEPFRGKDNTSSYISYTLKALALLKEMEVEELEKVLDQNSIGFFNCVKSSLA